MAAAETPGQAPTEYSSGTGSAKRIDTAATALWNRMTVEEMTALDLAYAPPFAPVWDPILVAARQAAGAVRQAGASRR